MMEDEDVAPADVVVSSPFAVPDPPPASADARAAARMHRGEVYARRGLLVGAEAVSLDVVEHDYIAAYLYYCVNTRGPVAAVVSDILVLAKQMNYDVFNCLDLMDNGSFLKDLKFGPGDGTLHYYIYNWAMPQIPSNKLGLVLV